MTFVREGDRVTAVSDSGQELASVMVKEEPDQVVCAHLELAEDAPSGASAMLAYEVIRIAGERPLWLAVDPRNEKAARFYLKLGFEIDHLVMVRR